MTDSWDEYRRLVLSEIERIDRSIVQEAGERSQAISEILNTINTSLSSRVAANERAISALQVKAGIFGVIGGILATLATLLLKMS